MIDISLLLKTYRDLLDQSSKIYEHHYEQQPLMQNKKPELSDVHNGYYKVYQKRSHKNFFTSKFYKWDELWLPMKGSHSIFLFSWCSSEWLQRTHILSYVDEYNFRKANYSMNYLMAHLDWAFLNGFCRENDAYSYSKYKI